MSKAVHKEWWQCTKDEVTPVVLTGDEDIGEEDSIEAEGTANLAKNVSSVESLEVLLVTADTTQKTKKKVETDGAQGWRKVKTQKKGNSENKNTDIYQLI